VGDRLAEVVAQVQEALPNFFALTNQLTRILNNTANLTSNLNATVVDVRPAMTNVVVLTSLLREPGGMGVWALGTNGSGQLTGVLTNVNTLLVHTDTNLDTLVLSVGQTLDHVADITSNLNAQVQANTNMLSGISKAVRDTDDFIQGLKRHWLLRSAFKKQATNNVGK
jgi:ABC-type transporter Mla subunit MlaD